MSKKAVPVAAFQAPAAFQKAADGTLPSRLKIAAWGRADTNKGPVIVDETTVARVPAFQARQKFDRIALDFQHNTLNGAEPCKVAGYGRVECVPQDGVYLTDITYTPEGIEHAAGGHYPDVSPAVYRDEKGVVYGFHSVALCRQGEIDGLTLFSAEIEIEITTTPPSTMDFRSALIELLKGLGLTLPENPTDADLTAALTAHKEKTAAPAAPATDAAPPVPAAMAAEIKVLKDKVDAFEAAEAKRERDALVAEAGRAGKVIPLSADQIAKVDLGVLRTLVEKAKPGEVPLKEGTAAAGDGQPTAFSATETDLAVAKLCGMTADDLKKNLA